MKIRSATALDAALLSRLSMDVQRLHVEHRPGIFKLPEHENYAVPFFEEMLADPAIHIFLAEEAENALGYILCKIIERPETPFTFAARTLLIDQVSVRPEAHRLGVGTLLMRQVEVLAKELGVERIHLDSWDFNEDAHAFFERMGYQKFIFRFWRLL